MTQDICEKIFHLKALNPSTLCCTVLFCPFLCLFLFCLQYRMPVSFCVIFHTLFFERWEVARATRNKLQGAFVSLRRQIQDVLLSPSAYTKMSYSYCQWNCLAAISYLLLFTGGYSRDAGNCERCNQKQIKRNKITTKNCQIVPFYFAVILLWKSF